MLGCVHKLASPFVQACILMLSKANTVHPASMHTSARTVSLKHTHTYREVFAQNTQDTFSYEVSDPAERRTNILMDSLCLRDAFEFLSKFLFPFSLSLSIFLYAFSSPRQRPPDSQNPTFTTFEHFPAAGLTLTKARAHLQWEMWVETDG